jgi:hypothetical protein
MNTHAKNRITQMQADDIAMMLTMEYGAHYARVEPSTSSGEYYAIVTRIGCEPERRLVFHTQVERYLRGGA